MIAFAFFGITGCQQEFLNEDFDILDTESDLNYYSLSEGELIELLAAMESVKIAYENNEYSITPEQNLNISEKNLSYIKRIITSSNRLNKPVNINLSIPRLKSGYESLEPVDCVARTVHAILKDYGRQYSYQQVNSWINDSYPGSEYSGLPGNALGNVCNHFFDSVTDHSGPPISYFGGMKVIAILGYISSNSRHAVSLISSDGIDIVYRDDQNGGSIQFCPAWKVTQWYQVGF